MFIKTKDGSVLNGKRKILYFSLERFVNDICEGNYCFICGTSPVESVFNDEHILPQWILKKYNLYAKSITLPNESLFSYGQYTVSCCQQCNSLMGKVFENPIRDLITQGFEAVTRHIEQGGAWLWFNWLALIFLKTHLKDRHLRYYKDFRQGDKKISSLYAWEELHHIHCVVRSFYTGCQLDYKVFGSFLVLPAKVQKKSYESFDYFDLYDSQTVLLRLNDIAFIAVLNDACGALNLFLNICQKIAGPLSPIQLREVVAHLAFINLHLEERPQFYSKFDPQQQLYIISANLPQRPALINYKQTDFGEILYYCCKEMISKLKNKDIDFIKNKIKEGEYTFLFDENNFFLRNSMEPI